MAAARRISQPMLMKPTDRSRLISPGHAADGGSDDLLDSKPADRSTLKACASCARIQYRPWPVRCICGHVPAEVIEAIEARKRAAREAEARKEKAADRTRRPKREKTFVPMRFMHAGMHGCTRAYLKDPARSTSPVRQRFESLWRTNIESSTCAVKLSHLKREYLLERKKSTSAIRLKPMLRKGITESNARATMISKTLKGEWVGSTPLSRIEQVKQRAAAKEAARKERERREAERYKNTSASIHDVLRLAKLKDSGIDDPGAGAGGDLSNAGLYNNPLKERWTRYLEMQAKMNALWAAKLAKKKAEEEAQKKAEIERKRLLGLLDSEDEEGRTEEEEEEEETGKKL
jgi:hypothetical protein